MATTTLALRPARHAKLPKRNIVSDFSTYFGAESQLANWQRLCHDIGLPDDLSSINKCRKSLKSVYINIHDLIDKVAIGKKPKRFGSARELAEWTVREGKIYPKKKAKEGGPVRALMIHVFSSRGGRGSWVFGLECVREGGSDV